MEKYTFRQLSAVLGTILTVCQTANAAYYDTLPRGVRLFATKLVKTSNINSSYNRGNAESPYGLNETLTFKSLKDMNVVTKQAYSDMYAISPEAANTLTLGRYEVDANAKVNVTGFGFAWGITNHVTSYVSIPYYDAKVDIAFSRTQGNNYNEVIKKVAAGRQTDFSQAYQDLLGGMPDADGPLLQSVFVNYYGYKPLGSWTGKGYGDLEFGTMLKLTDFVDKGLAFTGGLVAPTGEVEDPDILQDISFGDGQWDVFGEFGGGFQPASWFALNSWFRYTYQMPQKRTLRAPHDPTMTISKDSAEFDIKLGNKYDYVFSPTFLFNDWLSLKTEYIFFYQERSKYESKYEDSNEILAMNTESMMQNARLALNISSTKLFMKKEFFLPASIEISAQEMFSGKNTPKYSRYDIELRFFF